MSQTRPKPELWEQICPLLDCEHRLCLKDRLMRKSCPKIGIHSRYPKKLTIIFA